MSPAQLRRRILFSVALGLVVVVALSAYGDVSQLWIAFSSFRIEHVPLIAALTLTNYLIRLFKWHWYLRVIGITDIPLRRNALIFFSGFSMVMTPGKLGEYVKCYWIRQAVGTPLSVSLPVVFAERVIDGLAMFVLALGGLIGFGYHPALLAAITVVILAGLAVGQNERVVHTVFSWLRRIQPLARRMAAFETLYESARRLFSWRTLIWAVPLGVVSWGAEGLALHVILLGLGIEGGADRALEAVAIFAVSAIVGALSMLPGGLGVAEASMTGLLLATQLVGNASTAAAATLLLRFVTLWFGVLVGILFLFVAIDRLAQPDLSSEVPATVEAPSRR